jgi:hypothetical protein
MEKALETEILKEKYESLTPERREEIKILAYELTKDKAFIKAAELLIKNSTIIKIDEAKFNSRLGLVAALSVAIASAVIL